MEDNKLLDKIEKKIIQILKKEGGASGLAPLKKAVDKMDKPKGFNLTSVLKKMKNVEKHKESDYILTPINEGEGSTLNISKAEMEKLHKDGKLEKDGHKIIFKVNEDAVKLSKRNMTMYGKKIKRESLEEIAGLFEKLCKKGQAYRRKRMAAGEKSSAYLSGRAVKVCKGQIKGEGK
tara:strand:+ start:92 stop:622 length:531 start_codon:yes stop_codon:yes gene_type:complete